MIELHRKPQIVLLQISFMLDMQIFLNLEKWMENNISLWLDSDDGTKMIINFNYSTDYQCQYYVLTQLVMNLKFPLIRDKVTVQRNSFSSLSSIYRPPPGFEGVAPKAIYPPSQFANKTKLNKLSDSYSPLVEDIKQETGK